jgi:hypothetical protein
MSIANSLLVALIVMSIVFTCLIALILLLRIQSFVFSFINSNKKAQQIEQEIGNNVDLQKSNTEVSNGELKLIGVDEKTTAMIMAVLSNELKTPLDEIHFKSIKLISS